jgi:transposase
MRDVVTMLERWQLDVSLVREEMYRAPTPRERERWHAIWLLAQGWSATQIGQALERDVHTIGDWINDFDDKGPKGLVFEQAGGSPPSSTRRNRLS